MNSQHRIQPGDTVGGQQAPAVLDSGQACMPWQYLCVALPRVFLISLELWIPGGGFWLFEGLNAMCQLADAIGAGLNIGPHLQASLVHRLGTLLRLRRVQ